MRASGEPHHISRSARAARQLRIETELMEALDHDEITVHGQPIWDRAAGQVVAIETLVRWEHPTRGCLPPGEFLDVAELSPIMHRLGRRILTKSCQLLNHLDAHRDPAARELDLFVNISGRQLDSGTLNHDIHTTLRRNNIPYRRLVIELTETFAPLITGSLLHDLNDLRRQGTRIAIDDVGTGYSSLARLTELPVDVLKIDRAFTAGMTTNTAAEAIVTAITKIGHVMSVQVVCEGVETPHQEHTLLELGCTTMQGFAFSPALPTDQLTHYLTTHSPTTPELRLPPP